MQLKGLMRARKNAANRTPRNGFCVRSVKYGTPHNAGSTDNNANVGTPKSGSPLKANQAAVNTEIAHEMARLKAPTLARQTSRRCALGDVVASSWLKPEGREKHSATIKAQPTNK